MSRRGRAVLNMMKCAHCATLAPVHRSSCRASGSSRSSRLGVQADPSRDWGSGHVAELDNSSRFAGGLTERHVDIGPFTKKFARVLTPQLVGVVITYR